MSDATHGAEAAAAGLSAATAIGPHRKEETVQRASFLWKLVVSGASPTRAVEALMQRDGISERQAWETWKVARTRWKTERTIERGPALAVVWHQAQDHLLRLFEKINRFPEDKGWYALVAKQISICAEIARNAGPDVLNVNFAARLESRQDAILRVNAELGKLPEDERRTATRFLARILAPPGDAGGGDPGPLAPVVDGESTPGA